MVSTGFTKKPCE